MRRSVWWRLLLTREDDLDLLQCFFLVLIVFFITAFSLAAAGVWSVTVAAWATFGSVFSILAIAGTPKWVAELIARSKLPGEVAQGIATSPVEPDLWRDDERGEFVERETVN